VFEDAALFNAQPVNASEILQRWVPPPGWNIEVESPIRTLGKLTCDVKGRGSKAAFVLRAVLGGCRLKAGEHILVFGRVSAILKDANTIEISTVRFFPTS
jgi:hypothetical protein